MGLKAVITADASKFFSEMKKVEGSKNKLNQSFKALAIGAAAAGAAIAATATAAGIGLYKLIKMGEEVDSNNRRLNQVAKSMNLFGKETEKVANRIIGLTEAIAKKDGVDRNQLKSSAAILMTFAEIAKSADNVGGNFDRAMQAAVDLAATGFGTVEANASALGKALNDPVRGITALTRSGVTFTQAEREKIKMLVESNRIHEAQGMILSAIENQVGGVAAATADTTQILAQQWGIIKERFSRPVADAFNDMSSSVTASMEKIEASVGKAVPYIRAFFSNVFQGINEAFAGDFKKLEKVIELIGQAMGFALKRGFMRGAGAIIQWIEKNLLPWMGPVGFGVSKLQEAGIAPSIGESMIDADKINTKYESRRLGKAFNAMAEEDFRRREAELMAKVSGPMPDSMMRPGMHADEARAYYAEARAALRELREQFKQFAN